MEPRAFLRTLFDAAVAAADPAVVLPAHLPNPPRGRTIVVGAGKASAAMELALERHWPGELSGLIVTRYARDYERSVTREMSPKSLVELQARRMVFNEIAPEEMARMRGNVQPVIDKHSKEVGDELVAQAYAAIEKAKQAQ